MVCMKKDDNNLPCPSTFQIKEDEFGKAFVIFPDNFASSHNHLLIPERLQQLHNRIENIPEGARFNAIEIAAELNSSILHAPNTTIYAEQVQYVRKNWIQQKRKENQDFTDPNMILNSKYSVTLRGDRFLIFWCQEPRMYIYMSSFQKSFFSKIEDNNELFMDGTFDIVPKDYSQLYIIRMKKCRETYVVA